MGLGTMRFLIFIRGLSLSRCLFTDKVRGMPVAAHSNGVPHLFVLGNYSGATRICHQDKLI